MSITTTSGLRVAAKVDRFAAVPRRANDPELPAGFEVLDQPTCEEVVVLDHKHRD
jgi:hypothetical protein